MAIKMAPRNTRRPKLQDDYTEEDDDRSSKRQKIDPEFQKQENEENEEMEDYGTALAPRLNVQKMTLNIRKLSRLLKRSGTSICFSSKRSLKCG